MPAKPKVAVVRDAVRYDGITKSLEMVQGSVADRISGSMRIVIKPDFFFTKQGMSTSADAVKAVLDFVLQFTNKKITIAEGLYSGGKIEPVFHNAGLHELAEDYGVRYVDLNRDEFIAISLQKGLALKVARTVINSDFRISLAVPKLVGGSFFAATANMAIGGVIGSGKAKLLSGKNHAAAVAEILKIIRPNLSVVDGFTSVVNGRSIETNFCAASADAVAADVVSASSLSKQLNKKIPKQDYLAVCSRAGIGQSSLSRISLA